MPGTALANGTRIGRYEITGWLGAGAMGVVYRARDERLGRDVGLKLISATLATDPVRVHRFEQEARAASQINHPNILAVYDVGTHADAPYIVSELLEGQTLGARLDEGALSARKAVDYARQIAEGLAAAHDKGIIHRDLKPDNLFITSEGRVKILDFGIAKLTRPNDAAPSGSRPSTDTESGTVLGTAAYMSPEQVRGEPLDARSDIFSFGAILYEMCAGRLAFRRDTSAETMVAILKEEPPPLAATPELPALDRIVARCLEKSREARYQSARDLAFGLEFLSASPAVAVHGVSGRFRGVPSGVMLWLLGGALALGFAATIAWTLTRPSGPLPITRFPIALPAGQLLSPSGGAHMVAMSPDGTLMAYVVEPAGLYLRSLADVDARMVPGTETFEVREPTFSPDGSSIAFFTFTDQTIKRIAVTGGAAVTICRADTPMGMSWGSAGIVFGQGEKGIMRVSPAGGPPEVLVTVDSGEAAHGPQWLPDGKHVLFTRASGSARDRWDKAQIVAYSVQSGERTVMIDRGSDAKYVPTGHIVYAFSGRLFVVRLDEDRLEVMGEPVAVVDGVQRAAGNATGAAQFSFSGNGSLAYVSGPLSGIGSALVDIAEMDREGRVRPLNLPPGAYALPRVSPDGSRIAFGTDDGKEAIIYTYERSGIHGMQRLTVGGNNRFPAWTADSTRVAFQSDREGDSAIFWQPANGSGPAERLTTPGPGESHAPESWSPRGDTLLFSSTRGTDVSLRTLTPRNGKAEVPFGTARSSAAMGAVFSPDGRWVAYATTTPTGVTLYVEPYPATGARYPLTASPSDSPKHPLWGRDMSELLYNPSVNRFEAVRITTDPTFGFGRAAALPKRINGGPPGSRTPYDITPDGKVVGLITAGENQFVRGSLTQIQIVLNWFEDLKTRAPR